MATDTKGLSTVHVDAPLADEPENGQGMVEYAFILVLVVLVVILLVTVIGTQTQNFYSNIQNGMPH